MYHNGQSALLQSELGLGYLLEKTPYGLNLSALHLVHSYEPERGCIKNLNFDTPPLFRKTIVCGVLLSLLFYSYLTDSFTLTHYVDAWPEGPHSSGAYPPGNYSA